MHAGALPDVLLSLVGDFLVVIKLVGGEARAGLFDTGHVVVPVGADFWVSPVDGPPKVGGLFVRVVSAGRLCAELRDVTHINVTGQALLVAVQLIGTNEVLCAKSDHQTPERQV